MSNQWGVKSEQAEVLEELEKRSSKSIPPADNISAVGVGVKIVESNIIDLKLFECELSSLPESIGNLKSLQRLDLMKNKLTSLPKSIAGLNSLKYLILNENNLTTFPETIGNLQSLEALNLTRNRLKELPDSFGNLKSLQILSLSDNLYDTFPESITVLKSLKDLGLGGNKLRSLPESIGNLQSLQTLNVSDNGLSQLPESIGRLKSLQLLYAEGPQSIESYELPGLTSLPESIGNLKLLKELHLSYNQLTTLPDSIGNLQSLQKLILSYNRLTNLPDSFGNLKSLQILSLSDNLYDTFPESITVLKSLKNLYLGGNKLRCLPESIGNLNLLQYLGVSGNILTSLPFSLWRLENLEEVYIERNPLKEEWKEIIKRDIPAIREYCRQRASIKVFLSHAVVDFQQFYIKEIAEYLKKQDEIYKVFYCEQDLAGNIDDFMNEKLPQCQLVLFFASKKSLFNSEDCKHELELAQIHNIQVVPIKGPDVKWQELQKRSLSRELGLEFSQVDFEIICEMIYNYIKKIKREIHLFDSIKTNIDRKRLRLKETIITYLNSENFKNNFKEMLDTNTELFQKLDHYQVPPDEYFLKGAQLIRSFRRSQFDKIRDFLTSDMYKKMYAGKLSEIKTLEEKFKSNVITLPEFLKYLYDLLDIVFSNLPSKEDSEKLVEITHDQSNNILKKLKDRFDFL